MGERTLYLIRHGQYVRDPERLTDLGRAQAELLAGRLRDVRFDAVHSSKSPRAVETAEPLRRSRPSVPGVRSRHLCETVSHVPRRKEESAYDAENLAKGLERVEKAVTRYFRPTRAAHRTEAIVFHGNFIRSVICAVLDLDRTAWLDLQIHNASLSIVRIGREGNRLICFNDTGHLPPALLTEM